MHQCKKCKREFKTGKGLKRHLSSRISCKIGTVCSKCDKEFKTPSMLQRHLNRKTPCVPEEISAIIGDNEENRCQFCNNTYATKSSLKRHQRDNCNQGMNMQAMMKIMMDKMDEISKENKELKQQLILNQTSVINNDNRSVNIINVVNASLTNIDVEMESKQTYFIFKRNEDKCKIGYSQDPEKRLSSLQIGNDTELYIYKTIPGGRSVETLIHQMFEPLLIRGEWYNLKHSQVNAIVDLIDFSVTNYKP